MEKTDREILKHMSKTLDQILVVLSKPSSKLVRIFELVAVGVGVLGIFTVIDIIKNWIGG